MSVYHLKCVLMISGKSPWAGAGQQRGEVSFTPKVSACNLDPASIAVVSLCSPSLQMCSWQAVPLIRGGALYVSRMEAKIWECW